MASLLGGLEGLIASRLAQPPDVTTGGDGITGLVSGLASGFSAGKQFGQDRKSFKEDSKVASQMVGKDLSTAELRDAGIQKPSFLQALAKGFLGAEGEKARGADPMFDIKNRINHQNAQMNDLQIAELLDSREEKVRALSASRDFSMILRNHLSNGTANTLEAQSQILDFLGRNPGVSKNPGIVKLMEEYANGRVIQEKKEQLEAQIEARKRAELGGLKPAESRIPSEGGVVETFETPTAQTQGQTLQLLDRYKAARERGDSQEMQDILTLAGKQGLKITTDKDGTQIIQMGPGLSSVSEPTTANKTRLQETIQSNLSVIGNANRVLDLASQETVGPLSQVGRAFQDRILANIDPDLASQNRANYDSAVAQLRASQIESQKSDGNIAEPERKEILKPVPNAYAPLDSAANVKNAARSLKELAAIKALRSAKALGIPAPKEALDAFETVESVRTAIRLGLITDEEAFSVYDRILNGNKQ